MNRKRTLLLAAAVLLLAVLGFSLWKIFSAQRDYREEELAHQALLIYRPELPAAFSDLEPQGKTKAPSSPSDPAASDPGSSPAESVGPGIADPEPAESGSPEAREPSASPQDWTKDPILPSAELIPDGGGAGQAPEEPLNESIFRLRQAYPDAVGWITVPGTNVDYPFVQAGDNSYYLRRGIDRAYLYAGVPFLDCRCDADFRGENMILYGHNLRNGSMFGTLERFKDRSFFREHREFYVFLENRTIRAEVLACVVTKDGGASFLYSPVLPEDYEASLRQSARCVLEGFALADADRLVTLSTCDYENDNGRVVVVGRITGEATGGK